MKKGYKVDVKGQPAQTMFFSDKELAEAYAITSTAWNGGKYAISTVYVDDSEELVTEQIAE